MREDRAGSAWVDSFASFRASVREGDIMIPRVALGEPLQQECEHFIRCIEAGEEPLTNGALGLWPVVRVLEAMDRSARNGGRVEPV